ncbi:MAG TPA: sigma-70 family RNA polymerase sigma factor [Gemmataceae bacterium]|jgi:RNA polymerase sigma factor (sigma-70 family)
MATPSLHPLLHYLRRLSGGPTGASDLDDAQLLRRFLGQRDEGAFTTIVQRYGAMVWALCVRRLGETPDAEDAFQATFLVLARKASSLRGPELLGPFLYGVAYRTALKLRGRRARLTARETALPEQAAEARREQVWSDLRPILDEEVNRLPTKYRQPVLLCYLQGLSSEEAARRLGCPAGTIFSRLARARDLLRRRLTKRGLGVSAGVLAAVLADNAAARTMPPAPLCESTIQTGLSFAAGTTGQAMSAPLAALVEGVLRSMFLSKVKFAAIVLLALGLVGSGAGFVAHRTTAGQPTAKPASGSSLPPAVADKPKDKETDDKPKEAPKPKPEENEAFAVAILDPADRLKAWREKLVQPNRFPGVDDPKSTLNELLDSLSKRYGVTFRINEKAFKGVAEVGKTEIATPNPIPEMRTSLATILRIILDRVPAGDSDVEAVFVVRKDHIEITTNSFLRKELGRHDDVNPLDDAPTPIPPLVWDAYEEMPLARILPRLAEISDYNVVADPQAGKELQTKITAQLNNVPIDTALRLVVNMARLSVVRLDNVFYVTTPENAKRLREQAKNNAVEMLGGVVPAAKPAPEKPAK